MRHDDEAPAKRTGVLPVPPPKKKEKRKKEKECQNFIKGRTAEHAQNRKTLFLLRIITLFPLLSSWGGTSSAFFRGGEAAVRNA